MARLTARYKQLASARIRKELTQRPRQSSIACTVNADSHGSGNKLPNITTNDASNEVGVIPLSLNTAKKCPQLPPATPVADCSIMTTKKMIEELNNTIHEIKERNKKLERDVVRCKWLLNSVTKSHQAYKRNVKLEKSKLLARIKRLEHDLAEVRGQIFGVQMDESCDVARIRPLQGSKRNIKLYIHIPRPRKTCPSQRSVQYRANILRECNNLLSDGNIDSQVRQIVSFIRSDTDVFAQVKQELLALPTGSQSSLTPEETLHFMSTVNLSFFQMKMIKRYFVQKKGLTLFCSDAKLLEESNRQVPKSSFIIENLPFQEDKKVVTMPCMRVKSLKEFIMETWQKTCRTQELVDFPEFGKSIWLAFGGDKGGPSTKFVICFLNVKNPHSITNLHLFACYLASDSCTNMNIAFGSYFQEFDEIKTMRLPFPTRDGEELRRLKIFLYGDTNFLCHFMGHQGSSSQKPCLFCHISLQDLRCPTIEKIIEKPIVNRTLPEIMYNAKSYLSAPLTMKNAAQFYNNIMARPLLPIEVCNIAIPVMHVQLGIAANLWSMMYDECLNHDLSALGIIEKTKKKRAVKVLQERAKSCETEKKRLGTIERTSGIIKNALKIAKKSSRNQNETSEEENEEKCAGIFCFGDELSDNDTLLWLYCNSCQKWYHTMCLLLFTEEEIAEASRSPNYQCSYCKRELRTIQTIVTELEKKLNKIQRNLNDQHELCNGLHFQLKEHENLVKFGQGPAVSALESSLDDLQIDRLAYHSGTFVGNHVHKMVTGDGPKKLTEALNVVALDRQVVYEELFTILGKIHSFMTAKRFLSPDEVLELKFNCDSFGTTFLKQFPSATIIPKIHMLVRHVPEFAAMHRTVGIISEQGIEALHAKINKYGRTFAGIRCKVKHLKLVMNRNAVASSVPANARRDFYPPKKPLREDLMMRHEMINEP